MLAEGIGVKSFFTESVLPVAAVVVAIVALTLTLFEVPPHAVVSVGGTRVPASAEPVAASASSRAMVNDTLTQVMRTLDEGRRPKGFDSAAATTPTASRPKPEPVAGKETALTQTTASREVTTADPKILEATVALGNAIRAIHEARTEEDLMHAEDLVRTAREQMESGCGSSPGPLCQSAAQIRSLGY